MTRLFSAQLILGSMLLAVCSGAANAQATRTWVSGVGNDQDPCSRTAPCKTFAAAIGKTAPGGEISVLDPGGFGSVTITQSITINGEGTLASILASAPSPIGITVAAGDKDRVILRNLQIVGAGGGTDGIKILSGRVTIDKCFIYDFIAGDLGGSAAINVVGSGNVYVDVRDTNITNSSNGFLAQTAGNSSISALLDNVRINDVSGNAVAGLKGHAIIALRNSLIKDANTTGVLAATDTVVNIDHSELTNNAIALSTTGGTIRLNDNSIYFNVTDLSIAGGGTIATAKNNVAGGNIGGAPPNGTVTTY